ncbi:MAG TPA: hypothetical protein PK079_16345 [Leptospiraceae bacterium]|nr:hypothetical protein [Leptospiraceae bacterium]HMW07031.1 hypothetical protein [Leptospiraceae bacterium]HMX35050.1 hypothetical protein [Leptospiraceae bacterium]HMY33836.1 hypothetical protein [Leptospiraceae bacterium]HMZ66473.1 hypothetical protein [Leptospiraceae bacterium]
MEFDEHFKHILQLYQDSPDIRILKLEYPIPNKYETAQEEFLEKFFQNNPFEIFPNDLETFTIQNAKIKRLKFDRRPSTFIGILRFIELYRQQFNSIKKNLSLLARRYKTFEKNDLLDPENSVLKNEIFTQILAAGRVLKKWTPQVELLYKNTLVNINTNLAESELVNGKGKGFVNLRKIHNEGYLNQTFHPYYQNLLNFCIMCIAFATKLEENTKKWKIAD